MSDQTPLSISVTGVEKIAEKLAKLPKAAGDAGVEQATNYLVGVLVNKEIPPYRYIPRSVLPWASEKQRRFVMMKISKGEFKVPYQRRGRPAGIQTRWQEQGSGQRMVITNPAPAGWIYGENQARRLGMIGWLKLSAILTKYRQNIYDSFMRGVKKALQNLGLQ